MSNEYILEMENISKSFPGVQALDNVSLKVKKGTVHALMGENGAGKSTLMKILIGMLKTDQGRILLDGEEIHISRIEQALHKGMSMIYQELNPIPHMKVSENIFVGREQGKGLFLNKRKMEKDTKEILKKLEINNISANEKLVNLTVAKAQMVEICKALSYNSKLIIMDEPTSAITEEECSNLFRIINNLKKEGVSFIFITHKMDEVYKIADEITVLRDGKYIGTKNACDLTKQGLIEMMVGREISQMFPKEVAEIGDVKLSLRNLTKKGLFENISFDVKKGEILGLAGLMGAGRTEVMESVFGYRKLDSGDIYIDGNKTAIKSPKDAIKHKMALITEDRKLTGLFLDMDIKDNIIMPGLDQYKAGLFLKKRNIVKTCNEEVKKYNIKTPSLRQSIKNLSGGNQQKVLVARWLLLNSDIIIVDEPTRGIDVGAKAEIHKFLTKLAQQGKCVIMISSELPEILGMSDRIVVMHEGRVTGILNKCEADQANIMNYATGLASNCS